MKPNNGDINKAGLHPNLIVAGSVDLASNIFVRNRPRKSGGTRLSLDISAFRLTQMTERHCTLAVLHRSFRSPEAILGLIRSSIDPTIQPSKTTPLRKAVVPQLQGLLLRS